MCHMRLGLATFGAVSRTLIAEKVTRGKTSLCVFILLFFSTPTDYPAYPTSHSPMLSARGEETCSAWGRNLVYCHNPQCNVGGGEGAGIDAEFCFLTMDVRAVFKMRKKIPLVLSVLCDLEV